MLLAFPGHDQRRNQTWGFVVDHMRCPNYLTNEIYFGTQHFWQPTFKGMFKTIQYAIYVSFFYLSLLFVFLYIVVKFILLLLSNKDVQAFSLISINTTSAHEIPYLEWRKPEVEFLLGKN